MENFSYESVVNILDEVTREFVAKMDSFQRTSTLVVEVPTTDFGTTLDYYTNKRLESRKKDTKWPTKLSKKEVICCKIDFIQNMYSRLRFKSAKGYTVPDVVIGPNIEDQADLTAEATIIVNVCKLAKKQIFKAPKQDAEGKYIAYKGLDAPVAKLLNIANSYIPSFEIEYSPAVENMSSNISTNVSHSLSI